MIWIIVILTIYCVGAWYLLNPLFKHFYDKHNPNTDDCPGWVLEGHIKQCKKNAIICALIWPIPVIFGLVSCICSVVYNLLERRIK